MNYTNSYITSPVVRSKSIRNLHIQSLEVYVVENESGNNTISQQERLKRRRRELAARYASITNRQSLSAINIMAKLKKLISLDDKNLTNNNRRYTSPSSRNSTSCPRCGGFGMSQFGHIQRGVCFCCGKLP